MIKLVLEGENKMKHEYKVVDIDELGMNEEMYINLLGNQGWELININNEPGHYHPVKYVKLYFKRPLKEYKNEVISYM